MADVMLGAADLEAAYSPEESISRRKRESSVRYSDLTGEQLCRLLEDKYCISQLQFARIIGRGSTQVQEWCGGRARIPGWVDLILELLDVKPEVSKRYARKRGVSDVA